MIIFGTGGFTREIINIVRQTYAYEVDYIIGGMGDLKDKDQILGVPIIKSAEMDELYAKGYTKIVNAIAVTPGASSRKINANSTISHGNIISDCCHIASGATLAGDVVVGPNTLIGQNCTIYQNVHIGKNVLIHNGCSIYKDVPDNSIIKM